MKTQQRVWANGNWIAAPEDAGGWSLPESQLVLLFGAGESFTNPSLLDEIRSALPKADVVGCTTAGEIAGAKVFDNALVATAICFDHTTVRIASADVEKIEDSYSTGAALAGKLLAGDIAHVLLFCYGLYANGTEIIRGISSKLPAGIAVTGALAGDGVRFKETAVYLNGHAGSRKIVAVGLYGPRLHVGFGSQGGLEPFGLQKVITRSLGNTLFELDGKPALPFYKRFLGPHAAQLPASSVFFPVNLRTTVSDRPLARIVCAIDENEQSITFAGDMPEGMHLQLLRTTEESLIGGAIGAAHTCRKTLGHFSAQFALMFTCIGRKMVLQNRAHEEVEQVNHILQADGMAGFYSYGEIAPFDRVTRCELHNQTMTLTVFSET